MSKLTTEAARHKRCYDRRRAIEDEGLICKLFDALRDHDHAHDHNHDYDHGTS